MKTALFALALAAIPNGAIAAKPQDITAPGPEGELAGALIPPAQGKPVVLIVPGSGPTDRDAALPVYPELVQAIAGFVDAEAASE